MRILVTRPLPDADTTAEKLRVLGHEPLVGPLLSIVPAGPPGDMSEPAAILATSRNAIRAISTWPQAENWHDRPMFVTGRATGDIARDCGFCDVRSADGDAADVAALLMSETPHDAGPILYPAARDRSEDFMSVLGNRGYDIRTVEAYRAEMTTALDPEIYEAIRSSVDGVLFYSRRTAVAFCQLVERANLAACVEGLALFALSDRVAEPLSGLGASIHIAAHPDEESLFALLPQTAG